MKIKFVKKNYFGKFKRKNITILNFYFFQDYDEVADGLPNSDDEGQEQISVLFSLI